MNSEQAREILAAYRPGTDDARDPFFAEALELMRHDAELKVWFDETMAFDQLMRGRLARVAVPAGLREAILAERKIIRPTPWWQHRLNGRQLATAAAVLLAGALVAVWLGQPPRGFAQFRRDIADQSWGSAPHLELKTTNLVEIEKFLAAQNISTNFFIPPTLAQSEVRGCSVLQWQGRQIPVICFNAGNQHLHLAVVDRSLFPDAPTRIPQLDQWQSWRTASWSRDDHSYVLTGLNTQAFVKKFRKAKHWDWES